MNNFNFIAPFYDRLARLVFGDSIEEATKHFLNEIQEDSEVLILGGGTGKILTQFPSCKQVTYLEKSKEMLSRAKAHKADLNVDFIKEDFLTFDSKRTYDFVICPFFLDCFHEKHLTEALDKIHKIIKLNGKLVVIDFQPNKMQLLMRLMHLFFSVFASLESKKLKNINRFTLQNRFEIEKEEFFHKNMIFSRLYRNL